MNSVWRRHLLMFILLYLVAMFATFPASIAWQWFGSRLPAVSAYGLQGSVWQGQAQRLELAGRSIVGVGWDLRGWPLLLGQAGASWHISGPEVKGQGKIAVALYRQQRVLDDVELSLPLSQLARWIQLPFGRLQGGLELKLDHLEAEAGQWQRAEGQIEVHNAALAGQTPLALGTIHITVTTTARGIEAALRDTGGPLMLDGVFTMSPEGNYRFSGKLAARPQASDVLRQTLSLLGQPGPDGRIQVSDVGQWPAF